MKTQFTKQLELIRAMALSRIIDRMDRCDILEFDEGSDGIKIGKNKYCTHLKKDKTGIMVFDAGVFRDRIETLTLDELCDLSDALN